LPYVDQSVCGLKSKTAEAGKLLSDALADTPRICVSLQDSTFVVEDGDTENATPILDEEMKNIAIRNNPRILCE
jgi:hypothetical protein